MEGVVNTIWCMANTHYPSVLYQFTSFTCHSSVVYFHNNGINRFDTVNSKVAIDPLPLNTLQYRQWLTAADSQSEL